MRYVKGHKEQTRQRILDTAVSRFRRDGIATVGLADLMSEAGLTHGGFYSHFASKEDLVKAVIDEAACHSEMRFQKRVEEGGLSAWIRHYCSTSHRDHPERGCVFAALGSELARHPKSTRSGYSRRVDTLADAIAGHLPSSMKLATRRRTALAIIGVLSGCLQMARNADNEELSQEILDAGVATALELAQIQTETK
jgi:AcrR family transcriptional regulator